MPAGSPGAVVIGGYINGLALVRALAARGIPTAVVRTEPFDIAHRSRYVSGHESVRSLETNPDRLLEALDRRAAAWAGWALIPANDGALAALAHGHALLSARFRVIAPSPEVASFFLHKGRMLEAAREVGLQLPRGYGPASAATAELPDLQFPVVVKPAEGHRFFSRFGGKLFYAGDGAELRRCISRANEAGLSCSVFDFIPGDDSRIFMYCVYIDARGEPSAGITARKLRQSPPLFGVARVAETVREDAALREATVELLRRIGYRGMAAAEFKLDPRDGTFRFIEVNGRSVVYSGLLRKAGLDLAGLAWSDHMDGRPERACPNGWPGVWINLHADLLHSTLSRKLERLAPADFLSPYRRPIVEAVWSARDPLPFAAQWLGTARRGVAALLSGGHRALLADPTRADSAA